jgi:tetratricopeptide (TPR) repeat protein
MAQDAVAMADRLLQLAPDVPDHLHDRLVALNRLGDAQAALGDNRSAAETFRAMVAQGNLLIDINPYSTDWADNLALALERLGDTLAANGDLAGALKSHRDCLTLREWLVGQDTSDPDWYRNLAISYARVATVLAETGDYDAALEQQEISLSFMRDLAAAFPDDPWHKIDLVSALDQTAMLLQDPTAENQEALAILEEMYANGTLPEGYEDWIAGFRRNLGLPTEF